MDDKKPYINLQVKWNLVRLISTTTDLCEQVGNVDLECPLEKGPITITKDVEIPNEIPNVSLIGVYRTLEFLG